MVRKLFRKRDDLEEGTRGFKPFVVNDERRELINALHDEGVITYLEKIAYLNNPLGQPDVETLAEMFEAAAPTIVRQAYEEGGEVATNIPLVGPVIEKIKKEVDELPEDVQRAGDAFRETKTYKFLDRLAEKGEKKLEDIKDNLDDLVPDPLEGIERAASIIAGAINGLANAALSFVSRIIPDLLNSITSVVRQTSEQITVDRATMVRFVAGFTASMISVIVFVTIRNVVLYRDVSA